MIQLYWKNATDKAVGGEHGIAAQDLERVETAVEAAHAAVMDQVRSGQLGYATLPARRDYRDQVMELVARYRAGTTDLMVLGIGGSALGNIALHAALNKATHNYIGGRKNKPARLWVLDNIDPPLVADTLKLLGRRLRTTVFNVISKSGETAETAAQFMIVRELLRKRLGEDYAGRIVATTDSEKGTLHDIAKAEGYAMLPVPGDVGGRFSVLSPVGLFSTAMTGIDIDGLLAGAAEMKNRVETAEWRRNPACLLAAVKFLCFTAKGKPIHVMMPYSNRLYALADWYRQLWAESLGKKFSRDGREVSVGPTPIKALGTTDQHSQVQLYREGPNDKLIVFLEVLKHPSDIKVPDCFADTPGLSYLRKARLSKLINAEKLATEYALAASNRPSVTIRFDEITPAAIGEFIYLYEFTTSLIGELLNINAYDQPAVELGKQATFALMGREGYGTVASEIEKFGRIDEEYLT
ncbi:MAG: glucose-6-phosphate isomerase [Planctomycetota bacterium]|jgi:glucose-6-phosphate isomerase